MAAFRHRHPGAVPGGDACAADAAGAAADHAQVEVERHRAGPWPVPGQRCANAFSTT